MRRLSIFLFLFMAVFFLTVSASAEDVNLLSDYKNTVWDGTGLIYNETHETLNLKEKGNASVTFEVGDNKAIWVYTDMGNYQGKGTGNITLEFLDSEGNVIYTTSSEKDNSNGSFKRYSYGDDELFAPIPENSASVRYSISFIEGEGSPYFRNFSLVMSGTAPRSEEEAGWIISGDLNVVQVKVTTSEHIFFIVLIFLVALAMFGIRKITDRIKKKK